MLKIVKKNGVCKDFLVKKPLPASPKGRRPHPSLPGSSCQVERSRDLMVSFVQFSTSLKLTKFYFLLSFCLAKKKQKPKTKDQLLFFMAPPNLPKAEEAPLSLPLGELSGRGKSRPYSIVCSVFDFAQTDEKSFI